MRYPVSDAGSRLHLGKFTPGNPGLGIPSSVDKAAHMNAIYDEMEHAIDVLGGTPTEGVNNQLGNLLVAYIASAVAGGVSGVRGGVSAALDTLMEIATALNGKSNNGHGHSWGEITSRPVFSDAYDQSNSFQFASSAAVNNLRVLLTMALAGKAGSITGTWNNFYIPDIPLRVKIATAGLTAAGSIATHTGYVAFQSAFPTQCLAVIPVITSLEDINLDHYATLSCHAWIPGGFFWKLRKLTIGGAWSCVYIAFGV